MERLSPGREEAIPWRGGEVVADVTTMEVVGGRGREEGLMPAARHCSSSDATVFFLGLEVPRPRWRERSCTSSICNLFFFSSRLPSAPSNCL